MKKKIVITGGGGFVGATLVRRMLKDNYDVHILVCNDKNLWRLQTIMKKITIHSGYLNDKKRLMKLLTKIRPFAILHLATYGSYPSQKDIGLMVETNIKATINLLECLSAIPYEHLIVAGSSSEYGKKNQPMSETDILEPNNYYGALKCGQTHLCQVYAKANNKPVTILRLFSVYGYFEEKGRLVRSVIEAVLNKKPILLATGKETRDLIFTEDVADAFATTLKSKPFKGEIFNIGTGQQTTIEELARKVIEITKIRVPIKLGAYFGRSWDSTFWVANMEKTHSLLKWRSKYTLIDGLKKTVEWYKKNDN